MRKILLGTTAVAGVALFGMAEAWAQEAPTVRVGGYFRFSAAYVDSQGDKATPGTASGRQAQLTNYDFQADAEIQVFVTGKAANGLVYGATIELEVDMTRARANFGNSVAVNKGALNVDEMYLFLRSPTLGELRLGDEDSAAALLATGFVANFASGGADGDVNDFLINGRGSLNNMGDFGDATKIIYLSPQFFGFDFGLSFALNDAESEGNGCNGVGRSGVEFTEGFLSTCDRLIRGGSSARRINEYTIAARYRGSFGPVGLTVSGGYGGSGASRVTIQNSTTDFGRGAYGLSVGFAGIQATAFGFTAGVQATFGRANTGYDLLTRTSSSSLRNNFQQFAGGISYTFGQITVGANAVTNRAEGSQSVAADRRQNAFAVGATYRLAPGLDLTAEYVYGRIRERGFDLNPNRPGTQDSIRHNVFFVQTRLAF
jgi:predicted porin